MRFCLLGAAGGVLLVRLCACRDDAGGPRLNRDRDDLVEVVGVRGGHSSFNQHGEVDACDDPEVLRVCEIQREGLVKGGSAV